MYNEIMKFVEENKEDFGTILGAKSFVNYLASGEGLCIKDLIEYRNGEVIAIKMDVLIDKLSSYIYQETSLHLIFIYCEVEDLLHFSCFKSESTAKEKIKERFVFYLVEKFHAELEEKGWCLIEYDFMGLYLDSLDPSKYEHVNKEEVIIKSVVDLSSYFEFNTKLVQSGLLLERKVRKSA